MKKHTHSIYRTCYPSVLGVFLLAHAVGCSLTPAQTVQSAHESATQNGSALAQSRTSSTSHVANPARGEYGSHEDQLIRGLLHKIKQLAPNGGHTQQLPPNIGQASHVLEPQSPSNADLLFPADTWRSTHRRCAKRFGDSATAKQTPPGFETVSGELYGIASWYGPKFHGKNTANGEVYDQYGLTAAHLSLPMNTWIEVENLINGSRVKVRVNDRGPYRRQRILDLSRKAAEILDMVGPGSIPVCIKVLKWPKSINWSEGLAPYQQYVIQVSAHKELQTASNTLIAVKRLQPQVGWHLEQRPTGEHAVLSSPFKRSKRAEWTARRLRHAGFRPLVRRRKK